MVSDRGKQNQKRLVVTVRRVVTPDAEERLSRVVAILLKAAAKDISQLKKSQNIKKGKPPRQVLGEDTLTGGGEDGDSHE